MSERANHHFVPQFYFRYFSEDGSQIHLLHRASERIIPNAPIKGQCVKRRFYGPEEIKRSISQMEGKHSKAIRNAIYTAWNPDDPRIDEECHFQLLQAVLVQRATTTHEVEKFSEGSGRMLLEAFKEYLKHAPGIDDRDTMVKEIEDGKITLTHNDTWVVLRYLLLAIDSVVLISPGVL